MKSTQSVHSRLGNWKVPVLFIGLALACAPLARAAGVVSTCDETHLRTALAGGGKVTFTCSGTITLTVANGGTITTSSNTTIDGTGHYYDTGCFLLIDRFAEQDRSSRG
jgi:hypothetical protein